MSSTPNHVLVIGAGLGGIRTVEALRSEGYTGRISLVGSENHLPYDRPPLSKQVLSGQWEPERASLVDHSTLDGLDIDLLLGRTVVELGEDSALLSDGVSIIADAFVIATGSRARRIPGQPEEMKTLRTLDDSIALKKQLESSQSVLIVGAGFIGTEIASAAVGHGAHVVMVEAMPTPFARTLGIEVGYLTSALIRENGVELLCDTALTGFLPSDDGVAISVAGGEVLRADLGVVGIGGIPETEWLEGSNLVLDNGIRCDHTGRAYGRQNVWAIGDAAAWLDTSSASHTRCEHWNSTISQAKSVASSISGVVPDPQPVPYFWSDQFGLKIQVFGRPEGADAVEQLHGSGITGGAVKGSVLGHFLDGRLTAVTAFGAPRYAMRYRQAIEEGTERPRVAELAASL